MMRKIARRARQAIFVNGVGLEPQAHYFGEIVTICMKGGEVEKGGLFCYCLYIIILRFLYMAQERIAKINQLQKLATKFLDIQYISVLVELWKIGKKVIRGMANEGIYETLEYESILEIRDRKGTKATFNKHKKIRYLQDKIIAYQDHGWGDGEILLNYRSSCGKAVDLYRSGYKTYILLSLQEIKNRGDVDEFNIQWNIRKGFLTKDGYWATDISQRTKEIKINIVFPKSRPPQRLSIEESNRKRTRVLGPEAKKRLPDGRWRVTWEKKKPRLYEIYVLRWEW
jgi:hypothetical protein